MCDVDLVDISAGGRKSEPKKSTVFLVLVSSRLMHLFNKGNRQRAHRRMDFCLREVTTVHDRILVQVLFDIHHATDVAWLTTWFVSGA